ncbi:transposase [Gluconobacter cerinus]|uniref:transposase n=1 Tax=Gluconobacter cerinus TaxID=38307 RepID=UPI001B8BDA1B|nr:transposase [Gluconobacter cerinus]MBS1039066.1 hypothetical protein [Gluconobacter cerinus]
MRISSASRLARSYETIASRGAQPVMPPRKNAEPWRPTSGGAIARNRTLQACMHLGRAKWSRWSRYPQRSRIETTVHCIKLLGQRLTAQDFNRRLTEGYVRVAILNHVTALGTSIAQAVA